MDYLGLTSEQTEKVLQFQDLTGIEDMTICRDVLQRHQWNLEVAVQEQLNIREGRPSIYATETRPPAVVNDHLGQHIYYTPPSDGSGSGFRGLVRAVVGLVFNFCYGTVLTFLQIGRRLLRIEPARDSNPVEDVLNFIKLYEEDYPDAHPVFYQGTYTQVLNDAKRELRFLLIYLHREDSVDTSIFCRTTLSNPEVITYINCNFLFWGCGADSEEGKRVAQLFRANHYPFVAVVVLKEGRMTIVSRMEGFSEPIVFLHRLSNIVAEFEINLLQARADRFEASVNRSLRSQQDEAFMESLRADQEKERRREEEKRAIEEAQYQQEAEKRAEEQRKLDIQKEKLEAINKVPTEPDSTHPDAVHVVFKLPCGTRLDRRFLRTHSLETIFYFVFSHPNSPDSFEITTNFPKRILHCRRQYSTERILTLEEAGLKNKEVLFINDLDA